MSNIVRGPQFKLDESNEGEKEVIHYLNNFNNRQRSSETIKLLKAAVFLAKSNSFLLDMIARDLKEDSGIERFDELYDISRSLAPNAEKANREIIKKTPSETPKAEKAPPKNGFQKIKG